MSMLGFTPLEDIKLETIDFKWIKQTTKISHLKRAIKLIQMDGNFFTELKQACQQRIGQIDPSQKYKQVYVRKIVIDNRMTNEDKVQIDQELQQWENMVQNLNKTSLSKPHQIFEKRQQKQLDPESYFVNNPSQVNNKKQAQNQRNKGNEAIKSKDYNEAIKYYTNSIKLDISMHQSYSNRALAYIKLKQFQKALQDCEQALKIDSKYVKAYHRKAKALIGLKNRVDAYTALQEAIKIEPDNSECLSDLKDLREQMNEQQKGKLEGKNKFKKITIQQDSEEEEEIQQKK